MLQKQICATNERTDFAKLGRGRLYSEVALFSRVYAILCNRFIVKCCGIPAAIMMVARFSAFSLALPITVSAKKPGKPGFFSHSNSETKLTPPSFPSPALPSLPGDRPIPLAPSARCRQRGSRISEYGCSRHYGSCSAGRVRRTVW